MTANGDTITGVTETSTGAAASATVGTYPHRAQRRDGTGLSNYTITYVNGTLTVNPAPLTITANNDSKTYGTLKTFSGTAFTETGLVRQRRRHHRRDRDQHRGSGVGDGGDLYHRGQRRERHRPEQLHHQLCQRHPDGQPGHLTITANNASKTYGTLDLQRHGVHGHRPGDGQRRHHHERDRDQHRGGGVGDGGTYDIVPSAATGG